MLKQTHGELSTITNNQMNDYSDPKYKDLYKEILIDQQWTWGKFAPIPYPMLSRLNQHHEQSTTKITRASSQSTRTD